MGDRDGKVEPFTINMVPGKTAPRFDANTTELTPLYASITERGMSSGRPLVDMIFVDPHGKVHAFTTSGRMMLLLAAAVQAAVIRNGEEPDYVPVIVQALEGRHPQAPAFDKALREIAASIRARLHYPDEPQTFKVTDDDMLFAMKAALLDVLK